MIAILDAVKFLVPAAIKKLSKSASIPPQPAPGPFEEISNVAEAKEAKIPIEKPKESNNPTEDTETTDPKVLSRELFRTAHMAFHAGETSDALRDLNKAIKLDTKNVHALSLKADIVSDRGDFDLAEKLCNRALKIDPQHVGSLFILKAMGRERSFSAAALAAYSSDMRKIAARHLSTARYLNFYSYFQEAVAHASAGMGIIKSISRDDTDNLYQRLALEKVVALEMQGDIDEALRCLDRIEGVGSPHRTASARARCEMERGNFAKAAELHGLDERASKRNDSVFWEAIPILYGLDRISDAHARYRLRGSSKALREAFKERSVLDVSLRDVKGGNLFLFTEGGPGDELRFSTMYGELVEIFDHVTIACDPRLHSLLSRSFPTITFLPLERHRKELRRRAIEGRSSITDKGLRQFVTDDALEQAKKADLVGTNLDILADLRRSRLDFRSPSHLRSDSALSEIFGEVVSIDRIKIGLSWRSMLRSTARNRHYFQPEDFQPFAHLPNAEYWIMQAGVEPDEIERISHILPNVRVADKVDLIDDFEAQAALLENMDVAVAPFTSMAELSGALRRPTILLSNSHQTTWRRNPDGSDVWHPSGFVVGPNSVGDRNATIVEAAKRLESHTSGGPPSRGQATTHPAVQICRAVSPTKGFHSSAD